jgi:hypothetical protein
MAEPDKRLTAFRFAAKLLRKGHKRQEPHEETGRLLKLRKAVAF